MTTKATMEDHKHADLLKRIDAVELDELQDRFAQVVELVSIADTLRGRVIGTNPDQQDLATAAHLDMVARSLDHRYTADTIPSGDWVRPSKATAKVLSLFVYCWIPQD